MAGTAFEKSSCKNFNRLVLKEAVQVWKSDGKIHITLNCPTVSFGKNVRVPVVMPRASGKDPFHILPADDFFENLQLVEIQRVGRYAVRLVWNDGHRTGIYTFQFLRELSENTAET